MIRLHYAKVCSVPPPERRPSLHTTTALAIVAAIAIMKPYKEDARL